MSRGALLDGQAYCGFASIGSSIRFPPTGKSIGKEKWGTTETLTAIVHDAESIAGLGIEA